MNHGHAHRRGWRTAMDISEEELLELPQTEVIAAHIDNHRDHERTNVDVSVNCSNLVLESLEQMPPLLI